MQYKEWLNKRAGLRSNENNCPLCGARVTYRGFNTVECGAVSDCPNFRLQPEPERKKFLYLQAMQQLQQGFTMRFRSKRDAEGKYYAESRKDWTVIKPSEYAAMAGLPPENVDPNFEFEQADV